METKARSLILPHGVGHWPLYLRQGGYTPCLLAGFGQMLLGIKIRPRHQGDAWQRWPQPAQTVHWPWPSDQRKDTPSVFR